MENTIENKLKFFGANLGASIWNHTWSDDIDTGMRLVSVELDQELFNIWYKELGSKNNAHVQDWAILLKRPTAFTNDEAIEIAKLIGIEQEVIDSGLRDDFRNDENFANMFEDDAVPSIIVDYMRSKGYAFPYMNISLETLIEWNWVKIIE